MVKFFKNQHCESVRISRNFQRGNTKNQRKALLEALLAKEAKEKADKVADILYEAFWKDFNVTKQDGTPKYHIAKKDIALQPKWWPLIPVQGKTVLWEGQVVITIIKSWNFSIRINSDQWDILYEAKELSQEDVQSELSFLKEIVADGGKSIPSPTSKFVPQSNTGGNMSEEDLEDLLAGYEEDPEGAKPR